MRIGVFGGSFDPIHSGHLLMAEEARKQAGLSRVVFMPTHIQPFKQDANPMSCDDRLRMVSLAIKGNPNFTLSTFELDRAEVSYTILSLRAIRDEYKEKYGDSLLAGESLDIAFIIGSDMFLMLEKWYLADELLREFSLVLCARPGFDRTAETEMADRLRREYGTRIDVINNIVFDVSSTVIKSRIKRGGSIRYLVPESVRQYLLVMANEDDERFAHTKRVIDMAIYMADRFGVDKEKARLAALVHDYSKDADGGATNNLEHGRLAAEFAANELGILDEDVLNAISYHTTGRAGMSDLEQIIFLADTVEPGRTYKDIKELREISLQNLAEGTLTVLESLKEYLVGAKFEVTNDTEEAIEDLKNRRKRIDR